MKVRIEDSFYDFDQSRLMLKEAMAVKTYTGLSLQDWMKSLEDFDPPAVAALVWILRTRAGEEVRYSEIDFNLADFEIIPDEGDADAADPTSGASTPAESG